MTQAYKCNDTEGVLPEDLHDKAIEFAKKVTGIGRPHVSHVGLISAYRQCFLDMKELNMLNEEFQNGTPEKSSY
jgi:hypothetical protein